MTSYTNIANLLFLCWLVGVQCAVLRNTDDVEQQGLYHKKDRVIVLTHYNIQQRLYGQPHAWFIQFYNSDCGHCRNLAPKFKGFAADVFPWNKVVHIGVMDCLNDENNSDCRDFEINSYPSLRYFHENYTKANNNFGDDVKVRVQTSSTLVQELLSKLKDEQQSGRLSYAPPLEYSYYNSLTDAMNGVPRTIKYTFMIFDHANSTLGPIVSLDTSDYISIAVRLVASSSELSTEKSITRFPTLIVVRNDLQLTNLTPKHSDKESILHAINVFLQSKNMPLPERDQVTNFSVQKEYVRNQEDENDEVFLEDLETALHTTLSLEISRHKVTQGEALDALRQFIGVLIDYFPFRANGKAFMLDLKQNLAFRDSIPGEQIERWVKNLKQQHKPVFATSLNYIKCLGSESRYRGHTCGLWTIFHTLTVAATTQKGGSGPNVLSAMHGYVKHFFACTPCAMHFQQMALKNNMSSIKENDKAVLWLWIAHNEVNLRIAGDETEDPKHPKVQFPLEERCGECRQSNGAWRLDAVFRYLRRVYNPISLHSQAPDRSSDLSLSSLDFTITAAVK